VRLGTRRRTPHAADSLSRSAGVTSVRAGARTTVYPCGTTCGPKHPLPYTLLASGTPRHESPPLERTVPSQLTRRHNGGSHRPPLTPAANHGHNGVAGL